MGIQECAALYLICAKGGPACDEELRIMNYVLQRMGFWKATEREKGFTDGSIATDANNMMLQDTWTRDRCGAAELYVVRQLYRAPEDILLEHSLAPYESNSLAPILTRVALVSAPSGAVSGINQQLELQIDAAIARAEKKGFCPPEHWSISEQA